MNKKATTRHIISDAVSIWKINRAAPRPVLETIERQKQMLVEISAESEPLSSKKDQEKKGKLTQWSTSDGEIFVPTSRTVDKLIPGLYEINYNSNVGIFFSKVSVLDSDLLNFPETNSNKIVEEIQKFWTREDVFKEYKLTYKRGFLLWGPPGSGKSSTIQLIMKDVIERDGVVVRFKNPSVFSEGMRKLKDINPDTPIVVLMEDIDAIIRNHCESEVLNILDGVDRFDKVIFLATTNYPENLGERIINRPSRFDKRFKISHPNEASRRLYFNHVIGEENIKRLDIDIEKWVKDTDGFSIAHLKEFFTSIVVFGDDYEEALETLNGMKDFSPKSSDDKDEAPRKVGFANASYGIQTETRPRN